MTLITNTLEFWTTVQFNFNQYKDQYSYICVACQHFETLWSRPNNILEKQNIIALAKDFIQSESDLNNLKIDKNHVLFHCEDHTYEQRVAIRLRFLDYCVNKFNHNDNRNI